MSAPSGTPTSGGRSSPYGGLPPGGGDGGSSENVLNKIVTPLRWGIGGLTKTVRSRSPPAAWSAFKEISRRRFSAHHASLPAQVRGFLGSPNAENEAGPSATMPPAAPVASEVRRTNDPARHSPHRAPHPSLFNPKRRRSTSRLFRPEDADANPDALAVPLATRSAAQPASEVPRVTQGAPSTANLLDALKQRNNLTREETQEVISLLQRHGQGFAAADAPGPSTAAMPPSARGSVPDPEQRGPFRGALAGGRRVGDGVLQHPELHPTRQRRAQARAALAPQRQGRVSAPGARIRRRARRAEPVRRTGRTQGAFAAGGARGPGPCRDCCARHQGVWRRCGRARRRGTAARTRRRRRAASAWTGESQPRGWGCCHPG